MYTKTQTKTQNQPAGTAVRTSKAPARTNANATFQSSVGFSLCEAMAYFRALPAETIQQLQQTLGNRVTQMMLAGMSSPPARRVGKDEDQSSRLKADLTLQCAAEHKSDFSSTRHMKLNVEGAFRNNSIMQRKVDLEFQLSQPGDYYEREADQTAQRATNTTWTPDSCASVKKTGLPVRSCLNSNAAEKSELQNQLDRLTGSGNPLPEEVRFPMEHNIGADFSGVRIYNDSKAADLSRGLKARAFTVGQKIYFGKGEYNLNDRSGRELIAHELAHTLQPGASNRIMRWMANGHQEITRVALEWYEKTFGEFDSHKSLLTGGFNPEVKRFLIERSAQMDNIEDDYKAYLQGKQASNKNLQVYNELKKEINETNLLKAKEMYDTNQLQIREPWYQLHHGEGGHYRANDGAMVNQAFTDHLIDLAVDKYKQENYQAAMVMLSDALHQAEDRGAHGEGNQFCGHDLRLGLGEMAWEKEHYRPGYDPGTDPDDRAKNKVGVNFAVSRAIDTFNRFMVKSRLIQPQEIMGDCVRKIPEREGLLRLGFNSPLATYNVIDLGSISKLSAAKKADDEAKLLDFEYKGDLRNPSPTNSQERPDFILGFKRYMDSLQKQLGKI
jgi:hypothetical protein